jgi:S-DNA-T family DNA segregation ATPase FtsK/SpoIIIE
VLQTKGAEALMKKGDALYSSSTSSDLRRIHAPYTSLDELKTTVECIIQRHAPTMEGVLGKENVDKYQSTLFGKESMYKNPN